MNPGNAYSKQQSRNNKELSKIDRDLFDFNQQTELWKTRDYMLRTTTARWITKRQPHICIVGAGVAGLRCADVLLDAGIKVTINEGRDRIGGRVSTECGTKALTKLQRCAKRSCMAIPLICMWSITNFARELTTR